MKKPKDYFPENERKHFQGKYIKQLMTNEQYLLFYQKYQDLIDKSKIDKVIKMLNTKSENQKKLILQVLNK